MFGYRLTSASAGVNIFYFYVFKKKKRIYIYHPLDTQAGLTRGILRCQTFQVGVSFLSLTNNNNYYI